MVEAGRLAQRAQAAQVAPTDAAEQHELAQRSVVHELVELRPIARLRLVPLELVFLKLAVLKAATRRSLAPMVEQLAAATPAMIPALLPLERSPNRLSVQME